MCDIRKRMKMRLNGWYRIGIILSVGWFVYAFGSYNTGRLDTALNLTTAKYDGCMIDLASSGASESGKHETCSKKRNAEIDRMLKGSSWHALEYAIIPLIGAWLAMFIALFLFRWVRAGFAPPKA